MDQVFVGLSWAGVILLIVAHVAVSLNIAKGKASQLSAAGAGLNIVASAGMAIWPVMILNIIWMGISIRGGRVRERTVFRLPWDAGILLAGIPVGLCWILGAQLVVWAASAVYLMAWFAFSFGAIMRISYLSTCAVAGVLVVPALIKIGAHAFAFNEAFGVVIGILGVLHILRATRAPDAAGTSGSTP